MKRKARNIIAAGIGLGLILTGYVRRAQKKTGKDEILAIYFHNPSKKLFEKSVKWLLKNGFNIIDTRTLFEFLYEKKSPPAKAVWISLDDGWKDNMVNVFPYAVENKIPLTFFISTEPVEFSGVFWWRTAENLRDMLPEPFKTDIDELWKVPEEKRAQVTKELMEKAKGKLEREAMTVDEVKKISQYDFFTIGSHTVNHVITTNCSTDELNYELAESKKKLEEWTVKPVNIFCYPNGDNSPREQEFLKLNGYAMASAQADEPITAGSNPYLLPRFSIGEGYFYEELCHMFGVWQRVVGKIKGKKV